MSSKDFLKRMMKAGEKYSGGGGAGIISRVKIEFGLHRYVAGHEFWTFWKPTAEEKEIDDVGQELKGRLQQAGCNDEPNFGVKVTIDKNVLNRDRPYKADLQEFIPAWQKDAFSLICSEVEQKSLPMQEWFYGQVQYKANPFHVKKGEAGKTDTDQDGNPRFPSIRVPVEKFADEQAARAAAGGGDSSGNADAQWSDTLKENYADPSDIEKSVSDIQEYFKQIKSGNLPFDGAPELPKPLTPPNIKRYLAEMYACESQDIDIVLDMTPF